MKFCQEIKKEKVLEFAMNLIGSSKKNIDMTMHLEEEIKKPLPNKYHKKLAELARNNILVNRYTYGAKKLFNIIKLRYPEINTHYKGSVQKYQRILIIDKEKGLFNLNGHVFFTSYKPLIKSLLKYVKIL